MLRSNKDIFLNAAFYLLLAVLLATRILILTTVNIDCIDSDMPFMWAGIKDYAEGHFYEPRFYGQDYNTFMESLFAVPLYWCGVPVYYALPVIAHLVTLFPFLFTAFYLFKNQRKENALLILCLMLCLTTGYHIMTSLPRGISGVFFSAFFILSILYPGNYRFLILNTLLSVLAYFTTPNSVIVSVPVMAFLFFHNYRNKKYYVYTILCLLSYIPLYLLFDKFYHDHPDYIVFGLNNSWSLDGFFAAIKQLDRSFAHIGFFVDEQATSVILSFLIIGVALYKINKIGFLAFLAFLGIICISLFASKVREGALWPFYSYSRMYIGIPMALSLFSVFFTIRSRKFIMSCVVIALLFSGYKFITYKSAYAYHTDEKRWNGIHLVSLATVLGGCHDFKEICAKQNVNYFLISNTFWLGTYLSYGGPAIHPDFPETRETNADRRYWVREGNKNKIFERFIFLSVDYDFEKQFPPNDAFTIKRLDDYGIFLIENNQLTDERFIEFVNKYERR